VTGIRAGHCSAVAPVDRLNRWSEQESDKLSRCFAENDEFGWLAAMCFEKQLAQIPYRGLIDVVAHTR
jgi:hypothetical protein